MPSTRAQTRPIMGAIEWFKCFFGAVYEGEPPLCSAPPMPSGSMQKSRLEGRAAPQGPGLVRSALARPAGVVSGSRAAGRLVSAGGCAGRLPPGTLGEEARRVAEMLLASGEADEVARRRVGRRFLPPCWWPPRVSWPAPSAGRPPLPAPCWRSRWSAVRRWGRRAPTGPRVGPHTPKTTLGVVVVELEDRVLVAQLLPLAIHGLVSAERWKSMRRIPAACWAAKVRPSGEGNVSREAHRAAGRPAGWGLSSVPGHGCPGRCCDARSGVGPAVRSAPARPGRAGHAGAGRPAAGPPRPPVA